ncbi:50S ribosomal protein L21e [Candidatus Micrarchaeota archaeon]|nr:50S ribosomal protein L21e [Candidatus Micrarchaeota archaeon]MBD3417566.1 50S ribosomal protein L21e [Candidatus Micrarchaeota archaeon]
MVKNSRGFLSGRTKNLKHKRKLTVSDKVRTFKVGSKVLVSVKPIREGMPAPRYHGRHGTIVDRQGSAYIVEVKDGKARKRLVISPIHITGVPQ